MTNVPVVLLAGSHGDPFRVRAAFTALAWGESPLRTNKESFCHCFISSLSSSGSNWPTPLPSSRTFMTSGDWMGSVQIIQDYLPILKDFTHVCSVPFCHGTYHLHGVWGIRARKSLGGRYSVYYEAWQCHFVTTLRSICSFIRGQACARSLNLPLKDGYA